MSEGVTVRVSVGGIGIRALDSTPFRPYELTRENWLGGIGQTYGRSSIGGRGALIARRHSEENKHFGDAPILEEPTKEETSTHKKAKPQRAYQFTESTRKRKAYKPQPDGRICKNCKEEVATIGNGDYCCKWCFREANKTDRVCKHCKRTFQATGHAIYCTNHNTPWKRVTPEERAARKVGTRNCKYCGNPFEHNGVVKRKFCSTKCKKKQMKSRKGSK